MAAKTRGKNFGRRTENGKVRRGRGGLEDRLKINTESTMITESAEADWLNRRSRRTRRFSHAETRRRGGRGNLEPQISQIGTDFWKESPQGTGGLQEHRGEWVEQKGAKGGFGIARWIFACSDCFWSRGRIRDSVTGFCLATVP